MIRNGTMTEEEYSSILGKLNSQEFASQLKTFNDHKGLRRGELHTILGPKGGGKSTFVKTILTEVMMNRKNTYCFLSEEKTDVYRIPLYKTLKYFLKDHNKANTLLSHLFMESQFGLNEENKNVDSFIKRLEYICTEHSIDVVCFDNFTTSFLGRGRINDQARAIELLKELAVRLNIAVIIVLHTAKGTNIYKDIIDGDHVRGNATSVNIGSYNYIITAFFRANPVRVFVTTDKARYHKLANKKVYEMYYDQDLEIFLSDQKSSFDEIQSVIKDINKAKSKKKYGKDF